MWERRDFFLNNSKDPFCIKLFSNILFDINNNKISHKLFKNFYRFVCKKWMLDIFRKKTPRSIINRFFQTHKGLFCQGIEINVGRTSVSTIIRVCDFREFNISPSSLIPSKRFYSEAECYKMMNLDDPSQFIGELRGNNPLCWVTKSSLVNKAISNCKKQQADKVRNHLGLIHFPKNSQLLEIRYPKVVIKKTSFHSPTSFDGCFGEVFRSFIDKNNWGKTICLSCYSRGMPEAVHNPISFNITFKRNYIGTTITDPQLLNINKLLDEYPNKWNKENRRILSKYGHYGKFD